MITRKTKKSSLSSRAKARELLDRPDVTDFVLVALSEDGEIVAAECVVNLKGEEMLAAGAKTLAILANDIAKMVQSGDEDEDEDEIPDAKERH